MGIIFTHVVRKVCPGKRVYRSQPEGGERGRAGQGEARKCKGPEAGAYPVCSRSSKEIREMA